MEANSKKILASIYLDGREICKKVYHLSNARELIDERKSQDGLPSAVDLDRFLKYNADFNEFIDTDRNTDIKELDKFQLFFRSGSELADAEIELICPPAPLPGQTQSLPAQSLPAHDRLDDSGLEALKLLIQTKAPNILTEYEESGTLCTKNRMLLVRVAVSNLVERQGFYPSSDDKVRLAKNVVTTFPKLSVKIQEHNEGYEHYYDPASHSGFIEMKLRNLRRDMEESQRRYRRKNKSGGTVTLTLTSSVANTDEDVSEWVTLAKRIKPSPENLSTIKHAMDQTYAHRRIWITTQSPTLAEIFNQYPRFIDMPHLVSKFLIL
ncbi:uncharacterized protein LOC134017608 isoform X2 [Osmerus eperlanus]